MKFKEFADDTTEGVENKVKQLLTEKDNKFSNDLKQVKELMTKQYETSCVLYYIYFVNHILLIDEG